MSTLRRRIMVSAGGAGEDYVDLGLPSGLLWAKGNLIKDSQGNYSIGAETDWGTYVSWGNIEGHNEGDGYVFSNANYQGTSGYRVGSNISSNNDICIVRLGSPWRLPSKENCKELYTNTDGEWVDDFNGTGVAGRKFMKKTDHTVYIFIPASGYRGSANVSLRGGSGAIWSSSYLNGTNAYNFDFNGAEVRPQATNARRFGYSIRPVRDS